MDSSIRSLAARLVTSSKKSKWGTGAVGLVLAAVFATSLHAGIGGFGGGRRSVGGVMIDASGAVRDATLAEKQELAEVMRARVETADDKALGQSELRLISLKGLQAAISDAIKSHQPLPAEVEFLAGLQRLDYVFVDSKNNDIVIGGPAEPWHVDDAGNVVGMESGNAVMRLADLAMAFRSVESAANEGIRCSIEPTPEGRRRLQQLLRNVKLRPGQSPLGFEEAMKDAYGPQRILLTGVETGSRFARTMVAADFEMKRVAMGLVDSSVDGFPSYLQMSRNSRHGARQNPRWWMACDYDAMAKSEDGLAWKLSGNRVKTLTEEDLIARDGSVSGHAKENKLAQKWAESMNTHFKELSRKVPVFADLENLMDFTVLATLINQEQLAAKAQLDLSVLTSEAGGIELASYEVPETVSPQCSFIKGRKGWVVTASGGVDIDAFNVVAKQSVSSEVAEVAQASLATANQGDRWWWNR